jgi:hypothetical protein
VSGIFKAIILAAILGMLLPAVGHAFSRNLTGSWLRFGISIICLVISVIITYTLAIMLHWGVC